MERTLKAPAKQYILRPIEGGWVAASSGDHGEPEVGELAQVVAGIPLEAEIELLLPTNVVLFERLELPSLDRAELDGMVRLQLEKTLPFSVEDTTSDFQVLSQTEAASTVLVAAVQNSTLEALCKPLRDLGRVPASVSLLAAHAASGSGPSEEASLIIFSEGEELTAVIASGGKLQVAERIDSVADLPSLMLTAEMAGIPTQFRRAYADSRDLASLIEPELAIPVAVLDLDQPGTSKTFSLFPQSWVSDRKKLERSARFQRQLALAGIGYLLLLAVAVGVVTWERMQVSRLKGQIAKLRPEVESLQASQVRWNQLSPAVDPSMYTIEILHQTFASMPAGGIRITYFEHRPQQFLIRGEAPSASLAVEFGEKLRTNPALSTFQIPVVAPQFLQDEKVSFEIRGGS